MLYLCIFGQFFSLIRIGTIVEVTPFPTQIVNPVGETGAAEEEPAGDEQEYQGSGDVGPEEIGAPEHYLLAALPAEATSEYAGNPRQIACKCQRKGTHQGAAEGQEGGLDDGELPAPADEADADGEQNYEEGEAAEAEKVAHKQMPHAVSEFAGGIAYFCGTVHHFRIGKKAHVLLPVEEVGDARNEHKQAENGNEEAGNYLGVAALFVIPVPPESYVVCKPAHFFFFLLKRYLFALFPL